MKDARIALLALMLLPLGGCYYMPRSLDSYKSTFHEGAVEPNKADPYTFGGMADGTGGISTRTSYSTDSKSYDPRSVTETGKSAMVDSQRIQAERSEVFKDDSGVPPNVNTEGTRSFQYNLNSSGVSGAPVQKGNSGAQNGAPKPDVEAQKGTPQQPQPMRG